MIGHAPIHILLYEDNPDLRESLVVLLKGSPGFLLKGAFPNCEFIVEQVAEHHPDVILMDIDMPVVNGLEGLRRVKSHFPEVNVLMLTVFEDNENIFDAICSGAVGYLLKRTPPARLLEAILDASQGGAPMTSSVARKVLQMLPVNTMAATPATLPNTMNLTEREIEILGLLVKGNSYKMIAAQCYISIDTVRSHIKKIYEKLQVHSQAEAVAKALQHNMV
jgi:DNA-binding NarL/FixJ family response regulator